MIKAYAKKFTAILLILLPVISMADSQAWKILPAISNLSFTAVQNGSPVSGQFTRFSGEVNFYPDRLSQSNFNVIVDMGSVTNSYKELSDTLKTPEWFNVKVFPQAIFKSTGFTKTGDKTFQSRGTLTIRDKTQAIVLTFTQKEYTPSKYVIKGSTIIQRTAFGVGQGQWADTKTIKDDVQVNFTVTAGK